MRGRLPVYIENRNLPVDKYKVETGKNKYSYGYVNVLYLSSLIITAASLLTIFILGK